MTIGAAFNPRGFVFLAATLALFWGGAPLAHARVVEVEDTTALIAALASATPQETIALRPGDYAPVIHDFHGSVTLTSADPGRPAVLTTFTVIHSSGITMTGLTLDNAAFAEKTYRTPGPTAFEILGSTQIVLSKLDVHGSLHGSLEVDEFGIMVRDSDHVTVENSDFHNLHGGIAHLNDTYLTIKNNDFHELRDDAIHGGGSSNILIEGNHCHNNHPDGFLDKDHPDCIQFWTSGAKTGVHDITIVGNRYEREHGHATQFIFLGNESHLLYDHIVIKDNVSIGSQWNAINVVYAHDVTIANNILTSLCAPEAGQVYLAWIATKDIDGLVIKDNVASGYLKRGGDTAVSSSHNATKGCSRQ